jgi:hypothetical protein
MFMTYGHYDNNLIKTTNFTEPAPPQTIPDTMATGSHHPEEK